MPSPVLGLCCLFKQQPMVRFRTMTIARATELSPSDRQTALNEICLHNAENLLQAVVICKLLDIKAFRITSEMWPFYTYSKPYYQSEQETKAVGYRIENLESWPQMQHIFKCIKLYCNKHNIHLSLHPGQFTVMTSSKTEVITNSYQDLAYHTQVARLCGVRDINLHLGGAFNQKHESLLRAKTFVRYLHDPIETNLKLTIENDDKTFTVRDLLKFHEMTGLPICLDIHHHRCNPCGLTDEQATLLCLQTWNRKPHFHISSSRLNDAQDLRPHADFIDPEDWPDCWTNLDLIVDVEAKAKELAVHQLQVQLDHLQAESKQL